MKILNLIQAIQNLSGDVISALIDKIGFGSIAAFVGLKASEQAGMIEMASDINAAWSMADWALLCSIIGTVSFFAKNFFEMYIMWKKFRDFNGK